MRKGQPAALDVRQIFERAHDAIEHPNTSERERWAEIVHAAFVPDEWHDSPRDGEPWYWHASSLCQCPREAILKRAGLATDGLRVESKNTFAIGHTYHALAQFGMELLGQYEAIETEIGGRHPLLPLAARADLIYRHDGEDYIVDWKTESTFAGKHRREEATNGTTARHEHQIQVTAGAMVLQEIAAVAALAEITPRRFTHGWVVYIDKESGAIDQQPVEITEELRREVVERIGKLEDAWERWERHHVLPPMLPDERKIGRDRKPYMATAWQCRPRSESDPRGLYCSARTSCFARKEP
jgi:hypothetical protein